MKKTTSFIKALSVFVGTVIGVGIFGLPYVAHKAGFFVVFLYFIVMAGVAIIVHLIFGEVALGTQGVHRLPGYVGEYLGKGWKRFTFVVNGLGLLGALLAYLIVGGAFLYYLLGPFAGGNLVIYVFVFFAAGSYLVFRGAKSISVVELIMLVFFFAILVIFFIKAIPSINLENLQAIDKKFLALPYGVVLFSLWGNALVPEIKEIVGGDRKLLQGTIITGIILATVTSLFFVYFVVGASGAATSQEAITGLSKIVGTGVIKLGFIFGIITCFTSFITLGLTLKKILRYDAGLPPFLSWAITCIVPLTLFLVGLRKFIDIIDLTGALTIGIEGIVVIFLYKAFLKKKQKQNINPLFYPFVGVFALGIILTVFYFLF